MIRITARTEQDVEVAIVTAIAEDFAEWLESAGFEIVEKPGKAPCDETWDYAKLAGWYAKWKQERQPQGEG